MTSEKKKEKGENLHDYRLTPQQHQTKLSKDEAEIGGNNSYYDHGNIQTETLGKRGFQKLLHLMTNKNDVFQRCLSI